MAARTELHTTDTLTLSDQRFLSGDTNGKGTVNSAPLHGGGTRQSQPRCTSIPPGGAFGMDIIGWLWWFLSALVGTVLGLIWFLIAGWVSTLLQIAVL